MMHFIAILNIISAVLLIIYLCLTPFLIWRKTRAAVGGIIFVSSFVIGLTVWLEGLVASYTYLGLVWLFIGLAVAGVGVVPIGMVGSALHHDWRTFWILAINLATLVVVRLVASWASETESESTDLLEDDVYTPITEQQGKRESESNSWAQPFVDNLSHNIKWDHIYFVDNGIRQLDDDYRKFRREFIEQLGQFEFEKERYERELHSWNMYHRIKPVHPNPVARPKRQLIQ